MRRTLARIEFGAARLSSAVRISMPALRGLSCFEPVELQDYRLYHTNVGDLFKHLLRREILPLNPEP